MTFGLNLKEVYSLFDLSNPQYADSRFIESNSIRDTNVTDNDNHCRLVFEVILDCHR